MARSRVAIVPRPQPRMLIGAGLLCLLLVLPADARDLPSLYSYHVSVASTSIHNNQPQHERGNEADGSFLIPTFGIYSMDEDGYWDWVLSPVYADIAALLTYAKDAEEDLEDAVFSSGIVGHFVYGRYFRHTPLASFGAGITLGEYGFDSASPDEGYNFTVGPHIRITTDLDRKLLANLTARYEYALGHLKPDGRDDADGKPAFLALTLQLLPYDVISPLAVDLEYWKVLSSESDDLEVDRWQFKVGYRWGRDDSY